MRANVEYESDLEGQEFHAITRVAIVEGDETDAPSQSAPTRTCAEASYSMAWIFLIHQSRLRAIRETSGTQMTKRTILRAFGWSSRTALDYRARVG